MPYLPVGVAAFAAAGCLAAAFFDPDTAGPWRKRGLLALCALSLAFSWNWLYVRQVQRPLEALSGTEQAVTMTLCDYAAPTNYGAKVTVKLEGYALGKAVYYGDEALLDLRPGQTVRDLVSFQSAERIRDDDITTFTSKGVFLLAYQRGEPEYGTGTMDSPRSVARPGRSRPAAERRRPVGRRRHRRLHDRHPHRGTRAAFRSRPPRICRRRGSTTSWRCPASTAASC